MKRLVIIIGLLALVGAAVGIGLSRRGGGSGEALRVAVIPKGTTHDFWNAVLAGARAAGEESGAQILWNGPDREGDRERQIQIVEDVIVGHVAAIVLAPTDSKALVPVVSRARAAKIPCVIIDSALDGSDPVSFIATDNYQGGVIAARRMAEVLGEGGGKVAVLKYMAGSASTTRRERGFIETVTKSFPNLDIVEERYGMDTVETALSAAEDVLTRHGELDGIYAVNESTSRGALQALTSQGRAGQVKMIGFDASEPLLTGVREGHIDSLVVQNPYRMGYEGVRAAVAAARGESVESRVDTGVELVTSENIDSEATQQLLDPTRSTR